MNKRIGIILIITSILILLGMSKTYAVDGNFSVNKSSETLNVGQTTTFVITAANCGGKFTITSSNTNVATVDVSEDWIENSSKEVKITAKSKGTATITINAEDVATTDAQEVKGSKTIQITVKEETSSSEGNSTVTEQTKSSEARLNTFGINPEEYDFSGFSKNRNKEEWSATVPNSVKEVTVYATPLDKNAKVEGTGKVTLKEGNNTVSVKVTAEDGTTKTYKLTIKRKTAEEENAENGEARLKNLGIKPEEYDFTGFDSEKTEYSVEVPNEVEEVEVYATAMNSNAQINGTGMIELKEGKNELTVEVISANGTKKTYTITVTREESNSTVEEFGLKKLSINGVSLKPAFNVGTYEYTVELTEDIQTLEIQAEANDENATVEIVGNENLQQGENIITILVQNQETKENATYQIIVNKNTNQEIIAQTSWLKPETWGQEEKIKILIILVLIILIICLVVVKIKMSQPSNNFKNMDLPGAEELDKAIAEHQELSEESEYEKNNDNEINYIEDISKNRFVEINSDIDENNRRKGKHF